MQVTNIQKLFNAFRAEMAPIKAEMMAGNPKEEVIEKAAPVIQRYTGHLQLLDLSLSELAAKAILGRVYQTI